MKAVSTHADDVLTEIEGPAKARIASRDVNDWPAVAAALLLDCLCDRGQGFSRCRDCHLDNGYRGNLSRRCLNYLQFDTQNNGHLAANSRRVGLLR